MRKMATYVVLKDRKYSIQSLVVLCGLLVIITYELIGGRNYSDEVIGAIGMVYSLYLVVLKKAGKEDTISIFMLIGVIIIGIFSNMHSKLGVSTISILIDVIAETKFLWVFFAAKHYISSRASKDISRSLLPLAKVFCLFAGICALISQVVDIGMTESVRYGFKGFKFFFPMSFQFLAVALVAIGALLIKSKSNLQKNILLICCCLGLLLTTKSSPIFFVVIFIVLRYYFKKRETLKVSTIVLLALIVAILGAYQIETYLVNEEAPRHLFFYYGGVTANTYFPFGSGFSTFGSDQAARNYSELYYRYGFDTLFGMNPEDGAFLSDTFWPMAIGQFGWIGSALYIGVYVRVFLSFKKYVLNAEQKAFVYAVYLAHIIHAIGSAILSSAAGIIGAIALVVVLCYGKPTSTVSGERKWENTNTC